MVFTITTRGLCRANVVQVHCGATIDGGSLLTEVFFLPRPSHEGYGNFDPTGTYAGIGIV